jgi:hypothetical protein
MKNRWMKWMIREEKTNYQDESQIQYPEGADDNGDADKEEEDEQREDEATPAALTPPQDSDSAALGSFPKRAQGYSGVDAYRPKKKWFGLV